MGGTITFTEPSRGSGPGRRSGSTATTFDAGHGLLWIIDSKFGKSRELALDETVMEPLGAGCATSTAHGRAARHSSSRPPALPPSFCGFAVGARAIASVAE
jgi:hypothetical protein